MKKTEAIMDILAAYDAAELTGSSHHTVARYVRARDVGRLQTTPVQRNQLWPRRIDRRDLPAGYVWKNAESTQAVFEMSWLRSATSIRT